MMHRSLERFGPFDWFVPFLNRGSIARFALALLLMLAWTPGGDIRAAVLLADAPPPLPATFFGHVTLDGRNVPAGTLITAGHAGTVYGRTAVFTDQGVSVYRLDIPGRTLDAEGAIEGEILEFAVGAFPASQQAIWHSGDYRELDLTACAVCPRLRLPLILR